MAHLPRVPLTPRTACRAAVALWSAAAAAGAAHLAHTTTGAGPAAVTGQGLLAVVFAVLAAAVAAAGLGRPHERAGWLTLAAGIASYAAGTAAFAAAPPDPAGALPVLADALWFGLYPAALAAVVLLVRARGPRVGADRWLDGSIAGVAVAALGVTAMDRFVIDPHEALQVAPSYLGFALGELLVVGFGIGASALLGWRTPRSLVLMLAGFAALGVQDTLWLRAVVDGALVPGTLLDSAWLLVLLLIAAGAVWGAPEPRRVREPRAGRLVLFPFVFALVAVGLAAHQALAADDSRLAGVLTAVALLLVVVRFAVTFRAHLVAIEVAEHESLTDPLTGLGNRRRFLLDAEDELARAGAGRPVTIAMFDLDGFKAYNDAYGHPAGDELLIRLGAKLAGAVMPWGRAYRLGGDEFCVLTAGGEDARARTVAVASSALVEQGEAFAIASSHGVAVVPQEAPDLRRALQVADERLYAAKGRRVGAPGAQVHDALREMLLASEPDVDGHSDTVATLAGAVARRLGLCSEEIEDVARAAELHDIGKIAIPDAILHKPGPLDDEEWQFMRRHTAIGARFLASVPGLRATAELVRSSHERVDGGGYPDGLRGDEIPLGSRIIFACDAYDAMTSDRTYRRALAHGTAVGELRRHAGTQFDPRVVDALVAELEQRTPALAAAG